MKSAIENVTEASPKRVPQPLPFEPDDAGSIEIPAAPPDLLGSGREVRFRPRTLVFLEGDEAGCVFQITNGIVMLYKLLPDGRRQVVELLGPGDVFGFSSLPVHDCSAETLVSTRCTVFGREAIERSPALMRRLSSRLYRQLCDLHEHTMLLGRKSAMERMTSFLMRCIPGRGGHSCPGPGDSDDHASIRIAMTRQEIADYLGMTIETVSRSLTKLKRLGVLSINHLDEVLIHDVCSLCRMTGTHLTHGQWCSSRRLASAHEPPC